MTGQEAQRMIVDPSYVLVIDLDEMEKAQLTLNDVYAALDRGVVYSVDIYRVISKKQWMDTLIKKNDADYAD